MRTSRRRLRKLEKTFKERLLYIADKGADAHIKAEMVHLAKAIGEATEAVRLAMMEEALEEKPEIDDNVPF